ncbi:fucose-specific lectin [Hypoxylon trugodes]|uniref:fucose-specific lectin n=1 Tax=Hypoxylon trugodes TaxID=326681 RepID=UPI00219F7F77|nr:fucose-specific lectin [Hypoxylon trugodes]KAI1382945.1 fucose-specific lectin [Hypoxylon trugodes]
MASTGYQHIMPEQAGLEVVPHDYGMQVAPQDYLIPVTTEQEYKAAQHDLPIPVAGGQEYKGAPFIPTPANEGHSPVRRNLKTIIIVAVVSVLVIIGVVVGAVVGTQKSRSSLSPSPTTTGSSDQGDSSEGGGDPGVSEAQMTGSPTSVAAGLAPTAISWGYPHLEIFALTNNDTYSVYRKYRNITAESDTDFVPTGNTEMELVGGGIDTNTTPSIAINWYIPDGGQNRTELYINGKTFAYRKSHTTNETWDQPEPNVWDNYPRTQFVSAPTAVQYDPSYQALKVFYLGSGDAGLTTFYFQVHNGEPWSDEIKITSPDLQPMAPAVVAWNGDDTRLDIFAVSRANSHLLHSSYVSETAEWTDYEDLHGFVTTPPTAVSRTPGILDVFARGADAGLWHLSYDDGSEKWTNWTRISGDTKIKGQPHAISISSDSFDVLAWGNDNNILHKRYNSTAKSWTPDSGFTVLKSDPIRGPPSAVSDGRNLHVFAYTMNNELIWKTFDPLDVAGSDADASTLANVPFV